MSSKIVIARPKGPRQSRKRPFIMDGHVALRAPRHDECLFYSFAQKSRLIKPKTCTLRGIRKFHQGSWEKEFHQKPRIIDDPSQGIRAQLNLRLATPPYYPFTFGLHPNLTTSVVPLALRGGKAT